MKLRNRKGLIFIILLVLLLIILSIIIAYKNIGVIYNALGINLKKENEQELISMDIQVKKTEGDISQCLLIFTSNDENEKIKSIEYPEEKNNIINVDNEEGKQKIAIDYDIEAGKEDSRFKITTTNGKVIEKSTGYTINYDVNGENVSINNTTKIALINTNALIDEIPTREGYTFYGWSKKDSSEVSEYERIYTYQENDKDVTLYAVWRKNINSITANSLIEATRQIPETCQVSLNIDDEIYDADAIVYDGNLILDGNAEVQGSLLNNNIYEFGNKFTDVAKENEYAKNTTILKVNGDLTINEGVVLTACASENGYGGPKGLFIYCTGTLTNNGTISMTARGAYAEGQNVYLWKNANEDETYEYVPKVGASGGRSVTAQTNQSTHGTFYYVTGNGGSSANIGSRQTGGRGFGFCFERVPQRWWFGWTRNLIFRWLRWRVSC